MFYEQQTYLNMVREKDSTGERTHDATGEVDDGDSDPAKHALHRPQHKQVEEYCDYQVEQPEDSTYYM